jgi:phospholipase/lecithinase/hemolysin
MRSALLLAVLAAACSGTAADQKSTSHSTDLRAPAGEALQSAVRRLTDRSGKNTVVTTRPDGIRVYQVAEGMGEVVVARTNSDGSVTAKCVSTDKDGMVQGQSGAQK